MCESLYTLRDRLFCLFFAILMVGCAQAGKESAPTQWVDEATRPQITAENFPRLDGSTSAEPILAQIVCEFLQASCEWYDWIDGERRLVPVAKSMEMQLPTLNVSGTHEAYLSLIAGESDLILVARVPSADERALAQNSLVALDIQPIPRSKSVKSTLVKSPTGIRWEVRISRSMLTSASQTLAAAS
ncbi:MAG: hypothetical protein H6Q38_2390 [Chloroflexi bacterium]|nr:hypothetical protein [Chloroflexota bacterium]